MVLPLDLEPHIREGMVSKICNQQTASRLAFTVDCSRNRKVAWLSGWLFGWSQKGTTMQKRLNACLKNKNTRLAAGLRIETIPVVVGLLLLSFAAGFAIASKSTDTAQLTAQSNKLRAQIVSLNSQINVANAIISSDSSNISLYKGLWKKDSATIAQLKSETSGGSYIALSSCKAFPPNLVQAGTDIPIVTDDLLCPR